MNHSLSKYIFIGVILSLALTERIFTAAPHAHEREYGLTISEQMRAALTSEPYSPLRQWLMELYDSLAQTPIATLSGHKSQIDSVAISPDGAKVVTGSWDNTAKIWNMADGSLVQHLIGQ